MIDSNENPLGPGQAARDAMAAILPQGGRYLDNLTDELVKTFTDMEGLNPDHVHATVGSTPPLALSVLAFTSPQKSYVTADPGFELGMMAAGNNNARVVKVPLTGTHAHDVKAMIAADPDAGVFYICNPNNPTASLTARRDLEEFIRRVPTSVPVVIDEAYHHYAGQSGMYSSFIDHPIDDGRIIVTRTFSKVYGLAGMRAGYAVASEPTIRQLMPYQLWQGMNMAGSFACAAALKDKTFVERAVKRNRDDRQEFFNQAQTRMLKPLDSHTNFYFMDVARPARDIIAHFQKHNIIIGPEFPSMSTFIRVSFGLPKEMLAFWRVWDLLPPGKMSM
jgi:histidinol-phosphate aminotransferase